MSLYLRLLTLLSFRKKKFEPRRALICVLGTLVGGIISILIVLIRFSWQRNSNNYALKTN